MQSSRSPIRGYPNTGALLAESVKVALVVVLEPLVAIDLTMQRCASSAPQGRLSTRKATVLLLAT
jgi:hypothetical protein